MLDNERQYSTLSPADTNIITSCQMAIHKLSSLETKDPHAMVEYWDSWGKPSHGILKGHTMFLGYYDECINLKDTAIGKTKYCIYTVQVKLNSSLKPFNLEEDACLSLDCMEINESIDGVCYPSACTSDEFGLVLLITNNNAVTFGRMKKNR